jgi:hypothetical protein
MEYNLLKTIEPSLQNIYAPATVSVTHLLSPFPAHDFVNPGNNIYTINMLFLSKPHKI